MFDLSLSWHNHARTAHAGVVAYAIEETNYRKLAKQSNGGDLFPQARL